jgi:hypothetical protein
MHAGDTSGADTGSAAPVCALRAHIEFRNRHALACPLLNGSDWCFQVARMHDADDMLSDLSVDVASGRAHMIRLVDGAGR